MRDVTCYEILSRSLDYDPALEFISACWHICVPQILCGPIKTRRLTSFRSMHRRARCVRILQTTANAASRINKAVVAHFNESIRKHSCIDKKIVHHLAPRVSGTVGGASRVIQPGYES